MATSVSEEISRYVVKLTCMSVHMLEISVCRMKLDHDAALREASRLRTEVQSLRTDNLALREQVSLYRILAVLPYFLDL